MASKKIAEILGDKAESLLNHKCKIDKSTLTLPSPTYIDDIFVQSNRNNRVVGSMSNFIGSWPPWRHRILLHLSC